MNTYQSKQHIRYREKVGGVIVLTVGAVLRKIRQIIKIS